MNHGSTRPVAFMNVAGSVTTFDDGERDETIDVDVDPSGTTRSEALAELATTRLTPLVRSCHL